MYKLGIYANCSSYYLIFISDKCQDVIPTILPYYHIYGMALLLIGLFRGCKLVSLPTFESELFLNILKDHKVINLMYYYDSNILN